MLKNLKRQHNGFKGSDADGDLVFRKRLMLKKISTAKITVRKKASLIFIIYCFQRGAFTNYLIRRFFNLNNLTLILNR